MCAAKENPKAGWSLQSCSLRLNVVQKPATTSLEMKPICCSSWACTCRRFYMCSVGFLWLKKKCILKVSLSTSRLLFLRRWKKTADWLAISFSGDPSISSNLLSSLFSFRQYNARKSKAYSLIFDPGYAGILFPSTHISLQACSRHKFNLLYYTFISMKLRLIDFAGETSNETFLMEVKWK